MPAAGGPELLRLLIIDPPRLAGGLDAHGGPRHHRCAGLLQHRGAHQGHGHLGWGKHLPSVSVTCIRQSSHGSSALVTNRICCLSTATAASRWVLLLHAQQRCCYNTPVSLATYSSPSDRSSTSCREIEEFLHGNPAVADVHVSVTRRAHAAQPFCASCWAAAVVPWHAEWQHAAEPSTFDSLRPHLPAAPYRGMACSPVACRFAWAQVFGVPSKRYGEELCAWVKLK